MGFYRHVCFLFIGLALISCRKNEGANWDVDLALPVADTRLNVDQLVADSLLSSDSTGLLYFRFRGEVASLLLDSVINLPDTVIMDTLNTPIQIPLTPGQQITQFPPSELEFKIGNGIEIAFADLRQGFIRVVYTNQVSEALDLVYRIPSAVNNGKTFEIRETVPPGERSLDKTYDMSGYRLNMRGEKGNKYNTIVQTYTLGLNANASAVTVPANQGVILEISYSRIVPEYIEGFFGQEPIEVDADTVSFGAFGNISAEKFMLSDASMTFQVTNSIGADFLASLSGISAINSSMGKNISLNNNKLDRITLNWPKREWLTVRPSTTTLVFNKDNSNIVDFISNLPDKISYAGKVQINPPPAGDAVGHSNYAFYGSGIKINADVDIPLRFSAERIRFENTVATDFSGVNQLDKVKGGEIILEISNGFPFDAQLQVYLRDELAQVFDSLLVPGQNIINRAQLNSVNEVTAPNTTEIILPVDANTAAMLKRTRSLMIRSQLILPPTPPPVSITKTSEIEVKIRANLSYNVQFRSR